MNLKDAKEKAIPGPLSVSRDEGDLHGAVAVTLVDDEGVWVASLGNARCPRTQETAAHLALCYNTHDDLVEALERRMRLRPATAEEDAADEALLANVKEVKV